MRYPKEAQHWHSISNYVVCLSVKDENELLALAKKLEINGIKHVVFREPDFDNQATSISIEATEKARKLCSNFPLQFKEERKTEKPKSFVERLITNLKIKQNEQV
jgi:ATP-dependent RNA circularization protein (DNA/RNA ligase family)